MAVAAKILVIDDDLAWQDYYEKLLGQKAELACCRDAVTAINMVDECVPNLIILDFLLTGPTGMAMLNELQSYEDLAKIPVILVSSVADELGEMSEYGVVRVLAKDKMLPEDLIGEVEKWI